MKQVFPALFLLALCAGCAKTNHQYAVFCEYPVFHEGKSWIVVSNDAGNIIKIFDLPVQSSQLVEEFDYESKNASERYNLHLVYKSDSEYETPVVISYCGVQNGSSVVFNPGRYSPNPGNVFQNIIISGLAGMASVEVPGNQVHFGNSSYGYDPNTQSGFINVGPSNQEDLVIRIRPTPSDPFHSLYLPTTGVNDDTLLVNWSDFSPDSHFVTVNLPATGQAKYLYVMAVAPDFKRFATVAQSTATIVTPIYSTSKVFLPAGLHPQTHFRIRLQQDDYTIEKMFLPGEALRLKAPSISIKTAHFSTFRSLQIGTDGSPDQVHAHGYTTGPFSPQSSFQWSILGPPESLAELNLPDLSELVPELQAAVEQPIAWKVTAFQYEHLDYAQLLAGFPYKGGDGRVFPLARYGMQTVTKTY